MVGFKTVDSEWVGGLVQVPAYATGEGAPYRPEALFWLDESGAVCAAQVAKPGELLSLAAEILQQTIAKQEHDGMLAHAPTRLRVASPQLAAALRDTLPGLEIVCAATPEIDALLDTMREQFAQDAVLEQTYLSGEADVAGMSALFAAAAELYRVEPWESELSDHDYLFVSIPQLELNDAVLALTGSPGHSPGLVLLASLTHYGAYCAALPLLARGDRPALPRQLALNFERGAELSPGQRKEIVTHAWEVAGPDAYPWLVVLDEDLIARAPTPREITVTEVLALALSALITEQRVQLERSARDKTAFTYELAMPTRSGTFSVVLATPHARVAPHAPMPLNVAESARHERPERQDARTQGKLAANTGMASPLTVPLTEPS